MKVRVKICCSIIMLFYSAFGFADIEGKVVKVLDGDTLDVLQENNHLTRVRLEGIDAPEKSQPYGQRSRQMLSSLTANQLVKIKSYGSDRYGRILGEITAPVRINEMMVLSGMAWANRQMKNMSHWKKRPVQRN